MVVQRPNPYCSAYSSLGMSPSGSVKTIWPWSSRLYSKPDSFMHAWICSCCSSPCCAQYSFISASGTRPSIMSTWNSTSIGGCLRPRPRPPGFRASGAVRSAATHSGARLRRCRRRIVRLGVAAGGDSSGRNRHHDQRQCPQCDSWRPSVPLSASDAADTSWLVIGRDGGALFLGVRTVIRATVCENPERWRARSDQPFADSWWPSSPCVLVAAIAVGGWVAGSRVQSPDTAAARAAPPDPSLITAPVELRVLSSRVVTRGDVVPGQSATVAGPSSDEAGTVTGVRVEVGDELLEGDVVVEVSGRPVIVMEGAVPAFRTMKPGMRGADVDELQASLRPAELRHFGRRGRVRRGDQGVRREDVRGARLRDRPDVRDRGR